MATLRVPTLRNIVSGAPPYLRATQRRWAQVHDVRFLATQQSDRILEKYKEKLDRKAKEQGLRDIHELKEAYKDKILDLKKKASIPISLPPSPPTGSETSPSSSPFPPPPPGPQIPTTAAETPNSSTYTPPVGKGIKTLSSYLDIPKTLALPPTEISQIWRLRHASSPQSLCATIPLSTFQSLQETARRHPQFILPLPKALSSESQNENPVTGSAEPSPPTEIHFLQWTFPAPHTVTVLFTHLSDYKLRGEYAEPHTTITHHLELADTKGLVLMQGEVRSGRGVSVEEAKWLVMCLQKFYGFGGEREERKRLLELFGRGDPGFRVEELVEEAERIV